MKKLLVITSFVAIAASASALSAPPTEPFRARTWPASMRKPTTQGFTLGTLKVTLEKTTLAEVLNRVAAGSISHKGDAGESNYWLCYTLAQNGTAARLWITSHGEMGGPEHAITGVTVERLASEVPTADCPALPQTHRPASLGVPIWIGSTDEALNRTLGVPSFQQGAWRSYDFEGKVPGRCDGGFDLLNWFVVKSVGGTINSIYAGQVTSC